MALLFQGSSGQFQEPLETMGYLSPNTAPRSRFAPSDCTSALPASFPRSRLPGNQHERTLRDLGFNQILDLLAVERLRRLATNERQNVVETKECLPLKTTSIEEINIEYGMPTVAEATPLLIKEVFVGKQPSDDTVYLKV